MKTKLYICGPVSLGETCTPEQEAENTAKFYAAERLLFAAGYHVESPARILEFCDGTAGGILLPGDGECPATGVERWQWYMRRTLIQMLTCHGVATLEKVEQSRGCILELSLSSSLGMRAKSVDEWLRLAAEGSVCAHERVENVRSWELAGETVYIGECVDCKSTVRVEPPS